MQKKMKLRNIYLAVIASGLSNLTLFTSTAWADQWILNRSNKPYSVEINRQGVNFSGYYTGINNDSIFKGKFLSGRGVNLIHFVQQDDNGFYAIHSGKLVGTNVYEGRWYATNGKSGSFRLNKK